MPIHELHLLLRGRSSRRRWRLIGLQLANASGILVSLYLSCRLVGHGARKAVEAVSSPLSPAGQLALKQLDAATFTTYAWVSLAALGAVVIGVMVGGAALDRRSAGRRVAAVPAHGGGLDSVGRL